MRHADKPSTASPSAGALCALTVLLAVVFAVLPANVPGMHASAWAQGATAIVVQGNRRIEADTIRSYIHLDMHGGLGEAATDAALKELYGTGLFQDVNIKKYDGRIVVSV